MPTLLDIGLLRRDTPEIGGSAGGFIGLVVALSVIVVGASVGIFYLLRHHEPTQRDRAMRRERRETSERAFGVPAITANRAAAGPARREANASTASAWTSLSRMFRTHTGHDGWIQASGDAWEADEVEREMGLRHGYEDAPFKPPVEDPYDTSSRPTSSIHSYHGQDPEIRWAPRFTASHSTFSDLNTIPRSASPETVSDHTVIPQAADRHMSVDSLNSIRTFEGGTKFVEGL
uniref:Uncharacterized protein n=1 Tax=Mycena chlorophos TaxID=658473 RepID=A0ABQ0M775_MYCCL|nr:predicted protein [Mycena chlorophos]